MHEPDQIGQSELMQLQGDRLHDLLDHFFCTPIYARKLDRAGIGRKDIGGVSDLLRLPFTTKDELRRTPLSERSSCSANEIEYIFASGGTSGTPTLYYWVQSDSEVLRQAGARALARVGLRSDDLAMILAPFGLSIMWYCMVQQYQALGAGVIPLGVQPPSEVIDALLTLPATVITTLPVVGTRLAEFALCGGIEWPLKSTLRQFHCGGDFLTNARRRRIEEAWNVDCYNFFGMSEVFGPLAGECVQKDGMHLLSDYLYLEVLDPDTHLPVPDGVPGVAVYTTLWPKGSPLLRYWSDDFVTIDNSVCRCGAKSSRIHFLGRPLDMAWVNGSRLFASQVEERLLGFPQLGGEFEMRLLTDVKSDYANLAVETRPDSHLPTTEIRDAIEAILHMRVHVQLLSIGSLSRTVPKPKRIIDQRLAD